MEVHSRPESIDVVQEDLQRAWYNNRTVVMYQPGAVTDDLITNWIDLVADTLKSWPINQPYLAIHDLSNPGVSFQYARKVDYRIGNIGITPSGRSQIELIVQSKANFTGRVAIVLNLRHSGHIVNVLRMRRIENEINIHYRVFFDHDEAMSWLHGATPNQEPDPLVEPGDWLP